MSVSDPDRDRVAGERAAAFVERMRGMQSRFSSLFALALMLGLGGGALTWYYAHLWRTRSAAVAGQDRKNATRSEDAPLPEIGPIRAPAPLIDPPPAAAAPSTRSPADESTPALPLPEHVPPSAIGRR